MVVVMSLRKIVADSSSCVAFREEKRRETSEGEYKKKRMCVCVLERTCMCEEDAGLEDASGPPTSPLDGLLFLSFPLASALLMREVEGEHVSRCRSSSSGGGAHA